MAAVRRHAGRKTAFVAAGVIGAGLAISALAWIALKPPADLLNDPVGAAESAPDYIPGGGLCRPAHIAQLRGGPYYRPRIDRCAQAAETHRIQIETLKAQAGAADAAWAQARLTYLITRILVIGAIFTGWILGATLWAAWALSRGAPPRAGESADTARPVLQLDGVSISRRGGGQANAFFVRLKWKNVGGAPAVIEDCVVRCDDLERLPKQPEYAAAVAIDCPRDLAPGAAFETQGFGPAVGGAHGEARAVNNGLPVRVVVYGRLAYRDPAGRAHSTGFSMEVSPDAQAMRRVDDAAFAYAT
jgi:hypothetical protein